MLAPSRRQFRWTSFVFGAALALLCSSFAFPQGMEKPAIREGKIITDDVYVRSGSSMNHYTVCKLSAGTGVKIVGERGEWFEILPPKDAFSLISADYVDTIDEKRGVVNGENVRVRAGSSLSNSKYTIQAKLSRGAEVTILGSNPDGYLRIVPPRGATLWINRDYVNLVSDALAEGEPALGDSLIGPTIPDVKGPVPDDDGNANAPQKTSVAAGGSASPSTGFESAYREELEQIDEDTRSELSKPVLERNFAPLLERYQVVAGQDHDEFAHRYASVRIEQLAQLKALAEGVGKMRRLGDEARRRRQQYLEARGQMDKPIIPVPAGLDAQGVLRISALYPPGTKPRRYRLVDPDSTIQRTIGYIEIPDDSPVNVDEFIGRYVGVRASDTRLQVGGVNPVPIYLVSELVARQPPGTTVKKLKTE